MNARARHLVLQLSGRASQRDVSALARVLSDSGVLLKCLTQSTARSMTAIVVTVDAPDPARCITAVEAFASARGISVCARHEETGGSCGGARVLVTVLGDLENPEKLAQVAERLETHGYRIDETRPLGRTSFVGVELLLEPTNAADFMGLRRSLITLGAAHALDLAVQKDDFFRRSRRLLCMDVDSTFVKGEFIDELAELAGVKQQVATITARAMRGELDFQAALRERVALLKGLPTSRAAELCSRYELSPGAEDLVRGAQRLGIKVGLVSGGFDFFVDILRKKYELDFAFANALEAKDGVLTGRVLGTIVDATRKAQVLRDMAQVHRIRLEQTIAIGDGANDIQMLETAGLGVAYRAKPRLQEVADARIEQSDRLDTLFYMLGHDACEVADLCHDPLLPAE